MVHADIVYLRHILDAIQRIEESVPGGFKKAGCRSNAPCLCG